jgi:hypothetical protein
MTFSKADCEVLRELGRHVAEIAALPRQQETIQLWKALNGLKPVRPMVMIDQIPWHEMNVDDELTLRCQDAGARKLEDSLRQVLYRWKHMPADFVVPGYVVAPRAIGGLDFGVRVDEDRAVQDPQNTVVGHLYHDQLATEQDLEKIRMPVVRHDASETQKRVDELRSVFDGVLEVKVGGLTPMLNVWDRIVMWRGAESVLVDLGERPEFIHKLMRRVTDAYISIVDQLDQQGLMSGTEDWIHCTGAFTDDLPAPGYDPTRVRARDVWVAGMAQIFSSVSPAMHQEFDLDYLNPLYARFGLVYYGCCEPLDRKMDLVRKIPRLRKVSMSPWVDVELGAAQIGREFVFSRKPSPALLAGDRWDPAAVERDLRATLDACRQHGCPLELILKDISTVNYQPQRLWEWARIAQRLVSE